MRLGASATWARAGACKREELRVRMTQLDG